jgi:transketolase
MKPDLKKDLLDFALRIRIGIVTGIGSLGVGHIGGSLSVADLLSVLYGAVMKIDPQNPSWPERDKLVCSKGHAGPAVYAALALKGFFPYELLKTLNQPGTTLPSHCDRTKTPGIDMTTGSLGQGTSLAVGLALGDRLKSRNNRVFLITGDGEMNEGQVWEAAMLAAARSIDNLFWFVDENKKQLDGPTCTILPQGDFLAKAMAFGFDAQRVSGNDVEAIYEAIMKAETVPGKPHMIILDSIKGAGITEVEQTAANHSMAVTAEQAEKWIAALEVQRSALAK